MSTTLSAACAGFLEGSTSEVLHVRTDPMLEALERLGRRGAPLDLTTVLIAWWKELPRRSVASRQSVLESVRVRVKAGELNPRVLVAMALADPDAEIARRATLEYVAVAPVSIERRRATIDEALDWIRRGLALNRAAIFLALLSVGDEAINAQLASLRLQLSAEETAHVWQGVRHAASPATGSFVEEWRQVLEAQ